MNISKNLMSRNHTARKRTKKDIEWIVIHYVGALGDAEVNTDYYKSADVGASADFWVGFNGDIWQGNDYCNYYSWHCGGGKQSSEGASFFKKCTNANSIGIEMCVRKKSTKTMNATDTDWYFEQATIDSTVELVKHLMQELDVDADHVIRHFDVNGKYCPNPFLDKYHPGEWSAFKARLTAKSDVAANASKSVFSGIPESKQAYIDAVASIAVELYQTTKILPSVVIAQCCLETGYGLGSNSTALVEVNNLLGMKSDLINSTWKEHTVWNGKSISKITPEERDGKIQYVPDQFRVYTDYRNCIEDYEMFLLYVKNGSGYKYRAVQGKTDPQEAITIISKGGYATDSSYITKVMRLINENNFTKYDALAISGNAANTEQTAAKTQQNDSKTEALTRYRVQIGAFKQKINAETAVNKVRNKANLPCFIENESDGYHVYCGSFEVKSRAKARVTVLKNAGITAIIKKVK